METTLTLPLHDAAQAFAAAFSSAEESFTRAGRILADAVRAYGPEARAAFAAACPAITPGTWRRLEALGNGTLDPRLVAGVSAAGAILRRLPVAVQREALDRGVPLLLAGGDSLLVAVDNLSPAQARQVFAGDHVRDLAAQRAWLEANPAQAPAVASGAGGVVAPAWGVKGGKVVVSRPCTLTRLDLARMLAEMG